MRFERASGILLHPTSLPGPFGIGDLGPAGRWFCDVLADAGQAYWQILPLGPTGYGDSPYNAFSAFAGNTLLISPEGLVNEGLLGADDLTNRPEFPVDRVDYSGVWDHKRTTLQRAFDNYENGKGPDPALNSFARENAYWLEDYALFQAIRTDLGHTAWIDWPVELRARDPRALAAARSRLDREVRAQIFYQFVFFKQWSSLKKYANDLGVRIIGDIPIFVAYDSADVWCNQDKFKLDTNGRPTVVSGVPPDFFSKTGQLWGNPIYDWDAMKEDGFKWWAARVYRALRLVDAARLDHFRGFAGLWEVPAKDKTAENGKWVDVAGRELFTELKRGLGQLPFIAEDLGHITHDVERLRDDFGFPGMRILQFAFGGDARNRDLPHNYVQSCVAYTGTHDNDTAIGWFDSLDKKTRRHCLEYFGSTGKQINWDMIRAVWGSVADLAIASAQDILGLDSTARMNLPGSQDANWQWRMREGEWNDAASEKLAGLTKLYGRVVGR
jgi:4-alpha-glucanotransferase